MLPILYAKKKKLSTKNRRRGRNKIYRRLDTPALHIYDKYKLTTSVV